MVQLGANRYGKAEVRVVRVARGAAADGGDLIRDWNVSSSLSGDLAASHLTGDNAKVLTTDTQKNTTYAFAKKLGVIEPEAFGLALAEHYVGTQVPITRARVRIDEYPWNRMPTGSHSFVRSGEFTRSTVVIHDEAQGTSIVSGLENMIVLNTTDSEFFGFPVDEFTTLAPTNDRVLATQVSAWWRFRPADFSTIDFGGVFEAARTTLLETFAGTYTYSLQQMLYAIGECILGSAPSLCEVRLVLPNKHHFLVDLEPFGLDNENEVYYAADRPYGLIEGSVLADDAPGPGLAWD
jgi:urate oxidase